MIEIVGKASDENIKVLLICVESAKVRFLDHAVVVELTRKASTSEREKAWEKLW